MSSIPQASERQKFANPYCTEVHTQAVDEDYGCGHIDSISLTYSHRAEKKGIINKK